MSSKELRRVACADWPKVYWEGRHADDRRGFEARNCSPSVCRAPRATTLAETPPPFGRQIGPVLQGAGPNRQLARAWVRGPRLSYMLSPSTAFRNVGQVIARRCHATFAERLKVAAAPSEGPDGRASEICRCRASVRMGPGATSSGSTLQGVAEEAWPRGARRCFKTASAQGRRFGPWSGWPRWAQASSINAADSSRPWGVLPRQLGGFDQGAAARDS